MEEGGRWVTTGAEPIDPRLVWWQLRMKYHILSLNLLPGGTGCGRAAELFADPVPGLDGGKAEGNKWTYVEEQNYISQLLKSL